MKQSRIDRFWLIVKYAILSVLIVIILRGFVLIPVPVDGNSMEKTLNQGDMILMEKFTTIRRFDVIVFQLPDGSIYIKRVIGMPGDAIYYQDDQLYINEIPIDEPFLDSNLKKDHDTAPYTTNFQLEDLINEARLPEGTYFVLGDNRRLSKDSRSFGAVDSKYILGKAQFVYYPLQNIKYIPR